MALWEGLGPKYLPSAFYGSFTSPEGGATSVCEPEREVGEHE